MRKSRITFDIETAKVKTIVDLLIDTVSNFSVTEIDNQPSDGPYRQPAPKSWEWAKPVAVTTAFAMKTKPDREWHYADPIFAEVAKKHGLAPTTINQVLSYMTTVGRVTRTRPGHYKLISM